MIELSLEMCNDMTEIINSKDNDVIEKLEHQFHEKYNIDYNILEDVINDQLEVDYVNNNIYHIVPIVTTFSLLMNAVVYLFLQKNTSI
jgi:hypothetical protein